MTRPLASVVVAAALAAVSLDAQGDPAQRAVVRVNFTRGDALTPVTPVEANAIEVLVNGAPARVGALTPDRDPLSLAVVVDVTQSMSEVMVSFVWDPRFSWNGRGDVSAPNPPGTRAPDSPRALFLDPIRLGLLRQLRPGDRVSIATVSKGRDPGSPFAVDRQVIFDAARRALSPPTADRYGPSPIWDATDAAITSLESEPGRRVVVLITDGLSTGNRLGVDAVIDHAWRSSTAIFVVAEASGLPRSPGGWVLGDSTRATWTMISFPFGNSPIGTLARLAEATGGTLAIDGLRSTPDPRRRLDAIMRIVHGSHLMTLALPATPSPPEPARALDVRSRDAAIVAHAPRRLP
jgi:hypothetical protein